MRHVDTYIAGTGVWLADHVQPLPEMVAAGRVGAEHRDLGYESVLVDTSGTAAPDMAVAAGREAVRRSGVPVGDFALHLHASLWFQGLDYWSPANYIAAATVAPHTIAVTMDQRSSGGLTALHLAATYLAAGAGTAALITTGDRYPEPNIDRWNSQTQTIYGDGGAALVLSTRGGFARLLSTVSVAESTLEGYSRGTDPLVELPGQEIPIKIHKRYEQQATESATRGGSEGDWARWGAALVGAKERALADAGLTNADIARVVTPFVHRGGGQVEVHDALGFTEERTLWPELGCRIGHLGAGDQIVGLNHLVTTGGVRPGDRVLLFSVGVGFNFGAAVLEILDVPTW